MLSKPRRIIDGKRGARGSRSRLSRLDRMWRRLLSSDEREHEMVLNRLAIAFLIGAYLLGMARYTSVDVSGPLATISIYSVLSVALFAHLVYHPKRLEWRRVVAMLCDLGGLSYGIYVGGEATAALYPIYLWVILGNGFRFGVKSLRIAMAIGVPCFAVALLNSPYWTANDGIAIGLLLGMIALPLYASKLIRNLSEAKKAAEQASEAKSQFLAAVSHEFRTPLHGIIGMTDMLQRTTLDDEQKDMAATVRNSANALLTLINEVLDFSRIEAGQMPSTASDFELYDVLARVRSTVAVQAEAKGLRFAVHVSARTPLRLRGDARHLADILTNLAGNAVKFTNAGRVCMAVSLIDSGRGAAPDSLRLRFEVTDTGIGIAKEAQGRIFEHFSQADDTIINRFGGTGLGLAIVKRLVEMHGGEIGVESARGAGSTFWFELSYENAESEASWTPSLAPGQTIALTGDAELSQILKTRFAEFGVPLTLTDRPAELVTLMRTAARSGIRRCIVVLDEAEMGDDPLSLADALIGRESSIAPTLILISDRVDDLPAADYRSAFVTVLPRRPSEEELRRALQMSAATGTSNLDCSETVPLTAARRRSVLVADDNLTNQKVIAKVLEKAGHDVEIAENGELALDALGRNSFDIVLMDLNMPVMSGIEAMKLYAFSSLGQKAVPVVGLTADATPAARERCLEAGMVDCIIKPVEPADLLRKMEEIICRNEGRPVSQQNADGEKVASISQHPKYRASGRAVVDMRTLENLQELGGSEFVQDLVGGFVEDSEMTLNSLSDLCTASDLNGFRSQAHALRSGAANIGAQGIFSICSKLESIGEEEFVLHGFERLRELQLEVAQVRDVLNARMDPSGRVHERD
ncbi:two-component system sensor histidine kinase RpfC [Breoghania corrubedonensis]|uniref:Sensory/regulatory protein RpfC n=1 Tax=Breoghania corrubedonensis TaxID=665038 RepID=A0A2T5VIG1_9HYPH|nr:hybrid sensor histidine kinase/response regulator [Breoghania corrubedonensis]PTW63542.1 two-component system sensor histidine kinase RpfC [Breoghania corrubedonensis]